MSELPTQLPPEGQPLALDEINRVLDEKTPEEIIRWALSLSPQVITTTTFGDNSAPLLHMVHSVAPEMKYLWVDSGYNTPATYRYAHKLIDDLALDIDIYCPLITAARQNMLLKGIPAVDEPLHEEFTRQVKLEPFQRAFDILKPEIWITGIRKEETAHRSELGVLSYSKQGVLKVAPLFHWTEAQLVQYRIDHELPNESNYYDPTKAEANRECGLHFEI